MQNAMQFFLVKMSVFPYSFIGKETLGIHLFFLFFAFVNVPVGQGCAFDPR